MGKHIRDFLRIPPEIRPEFWQDSIRKDRLSLLVICIMIFGMEMYNMARVLLWSDSKLGTLNNRIYFGMYCALWLAAALYLLLQWGLRRAPVRAQWALQYAMALFALLWHMCINAYDLYRDPASETTIFITAVLGLAVFIQMPSGYSFFTYGAAYGLFMALAGHRLPSGDQLNLTFTSIVALAVSLTNCRHAVVTLSQRKEIGLMNQRLQALVQTDPLTGLLNKTAFQRSVELHLNQAGQGAETALMILDLDDFKSINGRHGHPCGDYVLKETALKLQALFPEAVGVGRIGGDEFAVALAGASPRQIEAAAQQVVRDITCIRWRGQDVGACCSLGVCFSSRPGAIYDALYGQADQALYQAKAEGKGRCLLRELDRH